MEHHRLVVIFCQCTLPACSILWITNIKSVLSNNSSFFIYSITVVFFHFIHLSSLPFHFPHYDISHQTEVSILRCISLKLQLVASSHKHDDGILEHAIVIQTAVMWHFCKNCDFSYSRIFLDKMSSIQLDKNIMQWVRKWLMARAQSVIVSGVTSRLDVALGNLV